MHVVTPRIIVAQVFESHEMKKIVFAEKREVASSQELRINKQQLLLDNSYCYAKDTYVKYCCVLIDLNLI